MEPPHNRYCLSCADYPPPYSVAQILAIALPFSEWGTLYDTLDTRANVLVEGAWT